MIEDASSYVGSIDTGMMIDDYQTNDGYTEQSSGGTGVIILTIVIIISVALGIFLGILAGKKSANK